MTRRHSKRIRLGSAGSSAAKLPLTGRRKWLFRLLALSLPFFALVLVEVGLRVGGYGYDTAFFRAEHDVNGKAFLINNDRFTLRFFPPELARWPGTFKLALDKPADVQRIFIFGESAALGDPQPSVGASRYLQVLLREKFPRQKFEIVNLGITAINSHVILPMAREVAARGHGNIWLVYMGNNEMVGPFGAATIFGSRAPALTVVRLNLLIQRTRVGQLAMSWLRTLGGKPANATWGGMNMFFQNQVSPEDPRRETVYKNFEQNLRDILQAGRKSRAKIVLSTVSVNLLDCPPFGSMLRSNLPAADRAQFGALYTNAVMLQTNTLAAEAAEKFAGAAQLDGNFAELQFRQAQCLLNLTNATVAAKHFQKACDVDALPFRADTRINRAIRSLATELAGSNLKLCDTEAAMAAGTADGIPGDEIFYEHVHFNFDGNYRLAKIWGEHIARLLPEETQREATADWASQESCERAIGLSDWNRGLVVSTVISRMGRPPLAAQFNNAARLQILRRTLSELQARQSQTNALDRARAEFEAAVSRAPADGFLHENYANFLESIGNKQAALAEYLKITEVWPHDFYGCLQAGRLLGELGHLQEAKPLLERAAAKRPSLPEPWFELGVVLASEFNYAEALKCFERAARMRPSDGSYLAYKAKALSKLNRRGEAIEIYRDVIKMNSNSWAAHFELAGELAATDQVAEGIKEYIEVTRLNPRHAVARVNLGVMLVRQNRLDEAIRQFEIALSLEPNNAAARDYLNQVTARRNQRR